jgi:hypothetical protein
MQRAVFHLPGLPAALPDFESEFVATVAGPFKMSYQLTEAAKPKRVAILASPEDHCLLDLLWRNRRGELDMSVAMVVANHPDLADQVRPFGVPFVHVPATRDIRPQAEQNMLDLLRGNVDLVVLARYMQILTPTFLDGVGCPVINIHHSFLPAFIGDCRFRINAQAGAALAAGDTVYPSLLRLTVDRKGSEDFLAAQGNGRALYQPHETEDVDVTLEVAFPEYLVSTYHGYVDAGTELKGDLLVKATTAIYRKSVV